MRPPLILLSGMGADGRVFAAQAAAIAELSVPSWVDPLPGESLASYASRLAEAVNPGRPCFIGGASFGGFVALEMVKHMEVLACFLIGSVRSPAELPKRITALRTVADGPVAFPFELASAFSTWAVASAGALSSAHAKGLLEQMSNSDASFLRWACRAVLKWEGTPPIGDVPIHHIHGQNDHVLPAELTRPDVVVPGAGHALSMSHPQEVTDFLKKCMDKDLANQALEGAPPRAAPPR